MTSSISSAAGRSPLALAAGFLGAFVLGSLAVQLVRSQMASVQIGSAGVEPVIAGPAAVWAPLGESDLMATAPAAVQSTTPAVVSSEAPIVKPIVGSEATLWAPLGER